MARQTTGPRLWTDPATGIHYVRFTYQKRSIYESTGTRNLAEAQRKAAQVFAEVVSGRRERGLIEARPNIPIIEVGAAWLADVRTELSALSRKSYEIYLSAHLGPFFDTLDRVTEARALDYRRTRLGMVLRATLLKELSCLRQLLTWCKTKGYISTVPRIESPGRNVVGTADTKRRHKRQPIPISREEAYAIIDRLPEFAYRARRGSERHRVRDLVLVWWETGLRPTTIAQLRTPENFRRGWKTLCITNEVDKNRYGREVPLTEAARQALERSCPETGVIFGRHDLRVPLQQAAQQAADDGLLAEYKVKLISSYDFRHGRTTDWASQTNNLAGVSFLVGHKEISTTARYVHANEEHARKLLEVEREEADAKQRTQVGAPKTDDGAATTSPQTQVKGPRRPEGRS